VRCEVRKAWNWRAAVQHDRLLQSRSRGALLRDSPVCSTSTPATLDSHFAVKNARLAGALQLAEDAADAALRQNEQIANELRTVQSELVRSARRAGMAEIANGVLHNAGNVLNGVAMDGVPERLHEIASRGDTSTAGDESRFRVRIEDNGKGIAPEDLTRLFVNGFTTRATGHGFGLHRSALAAKAMGGTLTAHSDGPGLGAVFTLDLPMQAAVHTHECV
jgi:two-component system, NtrC family, sensor kinase